MPYLEETYKLGYQSFLMVKAYELYKEDKGSSLLDYGVDFGFEDVRYLIVKSDSNVREVKALLSKLKMLNTLLLSPRRMFLKISLVLSIMKRFSFQLNSLIMRVHNLTLIECLI